MRIAIVSDIHGNLTALEAVVAELRDAAPDLILQGGDFADGGPGAAEVVDLIRDSGWPGVHGNTDEMLFAPWTLTDFAGRSPALRDLFAVVEERAGASRAALGEDRLEWLRRLPRTYILDGFALVHASPETTWQSPGPGAADAELEAVYSKLGAPLVVFGHIHVPFVRKTAELTVANSGSVGMPYDGDPRASFLLVDEGIPALRRVEYDIEREVRRLQANRDPHLDWMSAMLRSGRPQMPGR